MVKTVLLQTAIATKQDIRALFGLLDAVFWLELNHQLWYVITQFELKSLYSDAFFTNNPMGCFAAKCPANHCFQALFQKLIAQWKLSSF